MTNVAKVVKRGVHKWIKNENDIWLAYQILKK